MRYYKKPDPFYKSNTWRQARAAALERDHHICRDCMAAKAAGERIRPRTATTVHHILPIDRFPDKKLDMDNLISLCDACHNKRHPEKGGKNAGESTTCAPISGVRIIKV